jgi:hypothetical protein
MVTKQFMHPFARDNEGDLYRLLLRLIVGLLGPMGGTLCALLRAMVAGPSTLAGSLELVAPFACHPMDGRTKKKGLSAKTNREEAS